MKFDSRSSRYLKKYSKILGLPIIIFVIFLLLNIYVIRYAYNNISKNINEIRSSEKDKQVLEDKIGLLRQISKSNLIKADISYIALPDKNPGPWIVSHIRKISEKYGLVIDDISFSKVTEDKDVSNLRSMEFDLDMKSSSIDSNEKFFLDVKKIAPVVTIKEVEVNMETDKITFRTSAKINIYWSQLPTEVPDLTQPLNNLSDAELKILGEASLLTQPSFINLDPSSSKQRDEPFN